MTTGAMVWTSMVVCPQARPRLPRRPAAFALTPGTEQPEHALRTEGSAFVRACEVGPISTGHRKVYR